jgi:short-subunit dehydrogenase
MCLCRLPGIAMSAHDVATESVEAIVNGHTMVVPGLVNKLYMIGTLWLPPKVLRWVNQMAWT